MSMVTGVDDYPGINNFEITDKNVANPQFNADDYRKIWRVNKREANDKIRKNSLIPNSCTQQTIEKMVGIGLFLGSCVSNYYCPDIRNLSLAGFGLLLATGGYICSRIEKSIIQASKNVLNKKVILWVEDDGHLSSLPARKKRCTEFYSLSKHYRIKFLKANDLNQLQQKVAKVAEKRKIKSLIISAHGNPDYMTFEKEDVYGDETSLGKIINKLDPNGSIILNSCSVGEKKKPQTNQKIDPFFSTFTKIEDPDQLCVAERIANMAKGRKVYAAKESVQLWRGWNIELDVELNVTGKFKTHYDNRDITVVY